MSSLISCKLLVFDNFDVLQNKTLYNYYLNAKEILFFQNILFLKTISKKYQLLL